MVDVFLRINGYAMTQDSVLIYEHAIKLFETRTFDMELLVPWLESIVLPRA